MSNFRVLYCRVCAVVFLVGMGIFLNSCFVHTYVVHPPKEIDWKASFESTARNGVTMALLANLFRFEAPVKGRAPLVVDFRLLSKGYLQLEFWVEGEKQPAIFKIPSKAGVRTLKKDRLPPDLGKWQAAQVVLSAYDRDNKAIDFRLFGIGVGDRAVGSTGIYQVTFKPEAIRGTEAASWGFRSKHDFEQSRVLVYQWDAAVSGWREYRTLTGTCQPRRGKRCQGEWAGRDQRSPGRYRVAVKAWQSSRERDWIIEMSDQEVEMQ